MRFSYWVELSPNKTTKPIMRLFNCHLDHMGGEARKEGLKLILEVIRSKKAQKQLPVLLTGDFNDTPESGLLDVLESMESCYNNFSMEEIENSLTFHSYNGGMKGRPIDYIFSDDGIEQVSTTILKDSFKEGGYPSDHYLVLTTFKVKALLKDGVDF